MIVFHEAGPDDFGDILRLYRLPQPEDPVLQDGFDATTFAQILWSPGLHRSVLGADGPVVATTYLDVIPNLTRSALPYAVIENVVVEESLRGTGLGRQVMAGTLEAAWAAGCVSHGGRRRPVRLR